MILGHDFEIVCNVLPSNFNEKLKKNVESQRTDLFTSCYPGARLGYGYGVA